MIRPKPSIFLGLLGAYAAVVILNNLAQWQVMAFHAGTLALFATIGYGFYRLTTKRSGIINLLISLVIIFLVLHPQQITWMGAVVNLLAVVGLFLVKTCRRKGKPLANPAAFALAFSGVVTALVPGMDTAFISWWGAVFAGTWGLDFLPAGSIAYLLLAPAIIYAGIAFRKWVMILSFLVVQSVFLLVTGSWALIALTPFLAGIMLVEPKTSPFKRYEQIGVGALAALLVGTFHSWGGIDGQILALVATNLLFKGYQEVVPFMKKKSS